MPGEPDLAPSHRKKDAMIDLTEAHSANYTAILSGTSGDLSIYSLDLFNKVGTGTP